MSPRHFIPITTLVLAFGLVLFAVAQEESANDPNEIRKLQAQKVELLQDLVERYRFAYSSGKPVLEELLAVERDLLSAKLDMTISPAERVAIRESIVENHRKLVQARVAGLQLGKNAEADILRARVEKIDAEIALARETTTPEINKRPD